MKSLVLLVVIGFSLNVFANAWAAPAEPASSIPNESDSGIMGILGFEAPQDDDPELDQTVGESNKTSSQQVEKASSN